MAATASWGPSVLWRRWEPASLRLEWRGSLDRQRFPRNGESDRETMEKRYTVGGTPQKLPATVSDNQRPPKENRYRITLLLST